MKVTWETDGTTSKSKIIVKDDSKICSECGGYDGHFYECSKLEAIRQSEQVRLLDEAIKKACKEDKSHTEVLSE